MTTPVEMKVVMLIGNGFNCQIASLIAHMSEEHLPKGLETSLPQILNNLHALSRLGFCPDGTYGVIQPDHSILMKEENIRIIKLFLHSVGLENEPSDWQLQARRYLSLKIQELILTIGERFRLYQDMGGYRDIKKLFRHFGDSFAGLLETNHISKIHICTTNYDGVLDTLLTRSKGKDAFLFKDGFGNGRCGNLKEIKPASFRLLNRYLFHLHGSYKFLNLDGETCKVTGNTRNDNPVIVFNHPDKKERLISRDRVLSAYFSKLKTDLQTFDRLIIYGNSLINEPHIKQAIKQYFNRPGTDLVICSLHPRQVEKEVKPYYSQKIYQVATGQITTEQELLGLFDQLFKKGSRIFAD